MIYTDFKSIPVPEDNGKQNLDESYRNEYENNVGCSDGQKLVCVDDKSCDEKKHFNKKLS